jgi:hypothetical protein
MLAATHASRPAQWPDLVAELDRWTASGRQAVFWWRDDDATRPGPKLDRLIAVTEGIPLSLAVIPASAHPELARHIEANPGIAVLQHGFAHANHAPQGEKKAEFGAHRPLPEMLAEIVSGRERLTGLFGNRFRPVFVPPWNRIADSVADALGSCGIGHVSTFGRRRTVRPGSNCHIDIVDWHGGRGFLGTAPVLETLISLLAERREQPADAVEPIGILTHHRDHDEAGWRFLSQLASIVHGHPAAEWFPVHGGYAGH